jgi:uncharacterized protein (UPF0332 family)
VAAPENLDTFLTVADYLVAETVPRDDDPSWTACENARARAAVSRAYYSVFIALKLRLKPELHRIKRRFPSNDAHYRLLSALRAASHSSLAASLEELRRAREDADYEWESSWSKLQARDFVRKGHQLMKRVVALSDAAIRRIAREIGI